ncbi:MAG: 23S rRNA (uracil(1939)-C(5))-methyltransferase RlmD [Sphaerochaeta sp.]|nr:23S rRNA (uracil(1939)-C(5))-methyltransferase RlmD [Sphaerochaeta sp.]
MKSYKKCPLERECGGCQLMEYPYPVQLEYKQDYEEEMLDQFGVVAPIIGMEDPTHYRNKVQAVFGRDYQDKVISGIYREGTHHIVPIRECLVEDPKADAILATIRTLMNRFGIDPYDEDEQMGYIRHVLVKTSNFSGEVMVVLVCGQWPVPSKADFLSALKQRHPEITTLALNMNNDQTSMVLSEIPEKILYGKGYIEEELCGLKFRISPRSFFQVNPTQTEILYSIAMRMAQIKETDEVIDAYCGTGTIALIAGSKGAHHVLGIENNPDAVEDAVQNAEINHLDNVDFICSDASAYLKQMAKDKKSCDVLFLDPPRSGSDERFLAAALKMAPRKIIYISCNPKTLERDLRYMLKYSPYEVQGIQPVDMFPHTTHIETVILLTRMEKADFE